MPLVAAAGARRLACGAGLLICLAAAGAAVGCARGGGPYDLILEASPNAAHTAAVRLAPCGGAWCEGLWVGPSADSLSLVATLAQGTERASEIVWSPDGARVGVLVNGYQLRLYDPATRAPAGQFDLVAAEAQPTSRVARGVTFSANGAAITFDDCPRDRSGCRPGILGLR
jgi:hypothetical protein